MSPRFYRYGFFLSVVILLMLCVYFITVLQIDNVDAFEKKLPTKCKSTGDLSFLSSTDRTNVKKTFPDKEFLKSANWWCNETINSTLAYLDSINSADPSQNEEALISCLTDSALFPTWEGNNLDSLNDLLTAAEKYLVFAETTPERKSFYKATANAWIGYVTNKLADLVKSNNSLKYTFKTRHIRARCLQLGFNPDIGNNSVEKVVINFTDQNWKYLFIDRYWYGTSTIFKLVTVIPFSILLLLFSYGVICIFQKHHKNQLK